MATKTFLAILGVAIFAVAVQSYVAEPQLQNPISDVIAKLVEQVQQLADSAFKTFSGIVDAAVSKASEALAGVRDAVTKVIGPMIEQMKNTQKGAAAKGIDLAICAVDNSIEEAKRMPEIAFDDAKVCVDAALESSKKILDNAEKLINACIEEARGLADAASKCALLDPMCWTRLATQATSLVTRLPKEIAECTEKTVKELTKLAGQMVGCASEAVADITREATTLLTNVTVCAANQGYKPVQL